MSKNSLGDDVENTVLPGVSYHTFKRSLDRADV